jgi:serine/threonine protein kinase
MILKEVVVNTKEAYEAELALCEQRALYSNNNIVNIIGYHTEKKENFCSNFYKISIFIEVLEKTLGDKLAEAIENRVAFNEIELLLIAENMVSVLAYFQSKELNHGDIRPVNILTTLDSYKLSDPTLAAYRTANALLASTIAGGKSLLAPEVLAHLPDKEVEFTYDKVKADVFALGATLLEVATLTNSVDLYDYETGKLNEELLKQRLEEVRLNNSRFTYELIRDMLTIEEVVRPDFVQLNERFNPYRENIRARIVFYTPKPIDYAFDDELLRRVAEQIARSQELRASIEKGAF